MLYGIVRPDKKKAQFMPVLADELISRQVAKVAKVAKVVKVDIALTAASWSGFQAGPGPNAARQSAVPPTALLTRLVVSGGG
ncbi:hypothetical protein ACTMUQ_07145 [Streptomyces sp. SD11]|uniref:hypothetical protein n=1 Tax=Streptomyces sp. SD11 TaxID=3452209 RepID=UPI003F894005